MQNDSSVIVRKLFNHFYYKFYKRQYTLAEKKTEKKAISNFVDMLAWRYGSSIGPNWWIDYFAFSWEYWVQKNVKRPISLNWIVGKKMFERWLKRSNNSSYFYQKFLRDYDININALRQELFEEQIISKGLDPAEELEKARFVDSSDAQLYHCHLYTTLYDKRSPICLRCKNRSICKKLLLDTNPQLYKKRGYKS